MTINIIFLSIVSFLLVIVFPPIFLLIFKKHPKLIRISAIIFFVIYIALLVFCTTARFSFDGLNISLTYPNKGEWFSLNFILCDTGVLNILVNIFLLFPIGYMVYIFSDKNNFVKCILISFLVSLTIETYQFVLPITRLTELTDLVFNTFSGVISGTYCALLKKLSVFDFKNIHANKS